MRTHGIRPFAICDLIFGSVCRVDSALPILVDGDLRTAPGRWKEVGEPFAEEFAPVQYVLEL